jgi:prepilin-type N-terminal cleavage/methylation domain-containing protein
MGKQREKPAFIRPRILRSVKLPAKGFTLVELIIGMTLLGFIMVGIFGLYVALVNSTVAARQLAVGSTLATNQMEYLKSLPYDNLAVQGGSIYSSNPIPASTTQTVDGMTYTINTSISYVDDAYDGCTNYPNQTLKQAYCRNYPPPSGAPAVDSNPQDYKIAHVTVYNSSNERRGEVDTQISSRVSETNSTTGALFVSIIDGNGNPVSSATVQVVNNNKSPAINLSDSTDSNGIAIFYGLPPDTSGYHYQITASKSGYSTLSTITPSGSLQPNYPNQNILTQQSSYLTLTIKPQGQYSLVAEATDTSGNPISNVKIYVKGGYKKYAASTDTQYYFDNSSPDSRPATDSSGLAAFSNLVPGQYIFCGDNGNSSCTSGGTTYYLAAAVPYSGTNSFNPITVPIYDTSSPPSTTFSYNGQSYLQKVRLILTTNSSFPRVNTLSPDSLSLSSDSPGNFSFQIKGANLPGTSTVQFVQGSNTYTASCTGSNGTALDCSADLSGMSSGSAHLKITANGFTLELPDSPLLGGMNVSP